MGRTHSIAGVAIALGASLPLAGLFGYPMSPGAAVAFAAVAGGYSVLPDLDHPSATLAHTLGPVSKAVAEFVNKVSGGHRKGTHTLWFAAGMTALIWFLIGRFGVWVQAPTLFLGLFLVLMLLRIAPRGGAGEIVYALEAGAATWAVLHFLPDIRFLPVSVGVGIVAHILADIITTAGVPVLYPLVKAKVRLPILGDTGSGRETAFGVVCTIAAVWIAVAILTGNQWWTVGWVSHPDTWQWAV